MGASKWKQFLDRHFNTIAIITGVVVGLVTGFVLKSIFTISPLAITYMGLPGKMIIRAFTLIMIPLIVTSLSTSITSLKKDKNKRLITMTFALICISSTFVSSFGIVLTSIAKPGVRSSADIQQTSDEDIVDIKQMIASQDEAIYDVLINLIPDNVVGVTLMTHYTALVPNDKHNLSLGYKKVAEKAFKTNMLGLCAFSLVLGFAVMHLGEKAQTIKMLLDEANNMTMTLLFAMIKIMPIGMFSWMCVEAIKMQSPTKILVQLGWFFALVLLAYAIIWFVVFAGIYFLVLRKNPFKVLYNIMPALITGFGSCSSAAALPFTMSCMEEKNHLAKPISHFVLPLAMTMHMPGAATYYPMVAVFVAQMTATSVSISSLVSLCIYAVIQSMAFPAAPAGGSNLVNFVTTCSIIGIENPLAILAYIITLDWIFERIRTMTNVWGDCVIASIVEKYCHMESDGHEDVELNSSKL